MPRIGVEYVAFAKVSNELTQEGINLTIEAIRSRLKTGSYSTLARHLKRYKEEISHSRPAPIESLTNQVHELYARLSESADHRVLTIALLTQTLLIQQQAETESLRRNNRRWQELHTKWMNEKNEATARLADLTAQLDRQQDVIRSLEIDRDLLNETSKEKDEHNESLKMQLAQAQRNLEHFREASREQLMSEQIRHHDLFANLERITTQQSIKVMESLHMREHKNIVIDTQLKQLSENQLSLHHSLESINKLLSSLRSLFAESSPKKKLKKFKKDFLL